MNINQLRYFQTVCQQKSVTKAAETLHISQPSVSNALKSLENELQVSLFIRDHKKLTLTQTGEFFLEKVNHILNLFNHLHKEVKEFDEDSRRTIKIGVSVPDIKTFEQLFAGMQVFRSQVQFDFQAHTKQTIKSLIADGILNFGIIFLEPEDEKIFSHIILMKIGLSPEDAPLLPEKTDALPGSQNPFNYKIGLIWHENKMAGFPFEILRAQLQTIFPYIK